MSDIIPIIVLLAGVLWIGSTVGVTYDAYKHGRNPLKWFLAVAVFGLFGLTWYAISYREPMRPQNETDRTLLVTSEVVDVETNEKTTVQLPVNTDSTTFAIEAFEKKCKESGYQPVTKPEVTVE